MPFAIVIPENIADYEQEILNLIQKIDSLESQTEKSDDFDAIHKSILQPSQRPLIFYEETFTGFIIHMCSTKDIETPKSVRLTIVSMNDNVPDAIYNFKSGDLPQLSDSLNVKNDDEPFEEDVSDLVYQGEMPDSHGVQRISIWRFEFTAGCPQREASGWIKFSLSFVEPRKREETSKQVTKISPQLKERDDVFIRRSQNLLDGLNHSVFGESSFKYELLYTDNLVSEDALETDSKRFFPPAVPPKSNEMPDLAFHVKTRLSLNDPADTFQITSSASLSLKLGTTKCGTRNDQLLTTLSVEAPEQLLHYARTHKQEKYAFHVLAINAQTEGGKVIQLGDIQSPRRCALNEALNVTYKLTKNQCGTSTEALRKGSPSSIPIDITVCVRIEKANVSEFTRQTEWLPLTKNIATTWSPVLEFDTGNSFYEFPAKRPTPQVMNQSASRYKAAYAKYSVLGNSSSPKRAPTKNFASLSALPLPPLPPSQSQLTSPRVGWQVSRSPTRSVTLNKSSPMLSLSKGGFTRKKSQKFSVSHPGAQSGVAVNFADLNSVLSGLKLTFSGSPKVNVGQVATWKVQAINQTKHVLKMVLVSTPVPKKTPYMRSRVVSYNAASKSASVQSLAAADERNPVKKTGIMKRLHLYEQYKSLGPEKYGVVLLSTDVSLGVLEPNQVYEADFSFVGISEGSFTLSGLRLLETSTGEYIDIGKLLEVFVVDETIS